MKKKSFWVKIASVTLAVVMIINQFIPVSAKESNEGSQISDCGGSNNGDTYQEELDNAILSGSGTFEDPYIISCEDAPEFSEYLEECGSSAMENSGLNSSKAVTNNRFGGISTLGVNEYLTGKSHSNQTKGGYWKYTSGGPTSTLYNGNTVFKKVEYLSYNDVVQINSAFSDNTMTNAFKSCLPDVMTYTVDKAASILAAKGIALPVAKALCRFAGVASVLFTVTTTVSTFGTAAMQTPYVNAKNERKGVVRAQYNVAYQGQWYSYDINEVWKKYPVAYEPNSAYGTGAYKSH